MATVDLGKVAFVFRGTYNAGTTYENKDAVAYTDSGETSTYLYINTTNAANQTPSTGGTVNTTYWAKIASGTSLSVGNSKLVTTDASGNVVGTTLGSAGQAVKVNSGATGVEFGDVGGGLLQVKRFHYTGTQNIQNTSYVDTNIAVAITPTAADSHFWIQAYVAHGVQNHDANGVFNIKDSATGNRIFTDPNNSSSNTNEGYMSNCWSHGSDGNADNFHVGQTFVGGMYNPASNSSSARTFTVQAKTHQGGSLEIRINGVSESGQTDHMIQHSSYIEVWEIANGLYS
tara:strand:- start:1218 stop:2078 length:861 start_codon:yes stop_codon:yes gene_type:complete